MYMYMFYTCVAGKGAATAREFKNGVCHIANAYACSMCCSKTEARSKEEREAWTSIRGNTVHVWAHVHVHV